MPRHNYSSIAVRTELTTALTSTATGLGVGNASGYPAAPFTIVIDRGTASEEICVVTAVSGLNFTVTRGAEGTAAVSHSIGATLEHAVTARDYTDSAFLGDAGTQNFSGPITSAGQIKGDAVAATNGVTGASLTVTNGVSAGSVTATNGVSGATVTASGQVKGDSVAATAGVTGASVTATGQVKGDSLAATNGITGASATVTSASVSGTVTAGWVSSSNMRPVAASIVTQELVQSSSYVNMTTVGPVVTFVAPPSGAALVTLGAIMGSNAVNHQIWMGYEVVRTDTGAVHLNPADETAAMGMTNYYTGDVFAGHRERTSLVTGLAAGVQYRVTAKYRGSSTSYTYASRRSVTVIPVT